MTRAGKILTAFCAPIAPEYFNKGKTAKIPYNCSPSPVHLPERGRLVSCIGDHKILPVELRGAISQSCTCSLPLPLSLFLSLDKYLLTQCLDALIFEFSLVVLFPPASS